MIDFQANDIRGPSLLRSGFGALATSRPSPFNQSPGARRIRTMGGLKRALFLVLCPPNHAKIEGVPHLISLRSRTSRAQVSLGCLKLRVPYGPVLGLPKATGYFANTYTYEHISTYVYIYVCICIYIYICMRGTPRSGFSVG